MLAIREGNIDAAEVLLRYNADVDTGNSRGTTSLQMALRDKDLNDRTISLPTHTVARL